MIKFDDIINLIERCKTPNVRITDQHSNKIIDIENVSVASTISELEELKPMLQSYGKLQVSACDAEGLKANHKGAYKWIMIFDKVAGNQSQISGMGWNTQQQWMQPPAGYIHQGIMEAKLDLMQKQFDFTNKLRDLEKKNEDKFDKFLPFLPVVMSGLGWADEKIEKMMKYGALSKASSMAYAPSNTLTFKDVETMTPEQKNKKIQDLMDSLSSKVSAEHMILLLEAIDKKPELAEKAVNFLPML